MSYGFFQEPLELPHPPISLAVFLILEEALRVSWERLITQTPSHIDIKTAAEDVITLAFYQILYDKVFDKKVVEGFDKEHFASIEREPKVRNFDGSSPDKMPDLLIRLTKREVCINSQDGIFIECKPVNLNRSVGEHYGAKGIARFIRGDYAWAINEALMIAYTSPGYELSPELTETFKRRGKEFKILESLKSCLRSTTTAFSPNVHISKHQRTFNYIETGTPAPPIKLRHLWLQREFA